MAKSRTGEVLRRLRRAVLHDGAGLTDGQLLGSFIERRDEAAFAVLVRRHGPMVWSVCRRLLRHHEAEDAFQATFLVLVHKAASILRRETVASWLYGVAHRTALQARRTAARRSAREIQVAQMPEPAGVEPDLGNDLRPLLDQALSRLSDNYRVVIVLCDLEGKTRKEAARQLGLPEGTVASRLVRARAMLARRLARHGLAVSGCALAALLSGEAVAAAVPTLVSCSAIASLTAVAAGRAAPAAVTSPRVAALAEGVLKAMFLKKLKIATVVLLIAGVLGFTGGTMRVPTAVGTAAGGEKEKERPRADAAPTAESREVQVRIVGPAGMKVRVLAPKEPRMKGPAIEAPGRLFLEQGKLFRLKLADIPGRPGLERFPTLEIPLADAAAEAFVTVSAIPVEFTDRDFDQVKNGNAIVKVIYLPGVPKGPRPGGRQGEPDAIASYDAPETDVIAEARRRGTILAVLRMGNIDLEAPGPGEEAGWAPLPMEKAGNLVPVHIGDDGIQGRVQRAREKDNRAEQLAAQLEHALRDLAALRAENQGLKEQLKRAEVEVRSLLDLLERKEQDLKKARAAGK
jgi:RNA polymerase sigma factor (sigma-70 family)